MLVLREFANGAKLGAGRADFKRLAGTRPLAYNRSQPGDTF
jgi:hypothetical protein